jgi:carboxymethylenebutenolidase
LGKTLELTAADGFKLAAYRADPAGRPKAGLVVIQEIFGVNHHIRNVTDRFAALGYVALAPALFDRAERGVDIGYDAAAVERGRNLRAAISLDDTLKDMAAAIGSLQSAGKVGVIGYCWGGSLAFLAATRLPGLACAIGYYGGMIAAHAAEKPKVPVLLHFGEKDHGIPMSDVRKVMAARPETKVHIYPADHGFSCDERASFDRASHELALERSLAFMDEHLGR